MVKVRELVKGVVSVIIIVAFFIIIVIPFWNEERMKEVMPQNPPTVKELKEKDYWCEVDTTWDDGRYRGTVYVRPGANELVTFVNDTSNGYCKVYVAKAQKQIEAAEWCGSGINRFLKPVTNQRVIIIVYTVHLTPDA